MPVITVFLVDDHEVVRRGVRELLEAEPDLHVVGEASSVAEALVRVPAAGPQVAVLDVRLPDGNGVELCRELRDTVPGIACLMLTSFADDQALLDAVLAGAASAAAAEVEDSLASTPDPTAAAFFDVDNTMIRGASIYFFGKGMAGRGLITTSDLLRFGWQQLSFRVRGTENPEDVAEARDKALGLVAGKSVAEIVAYGEEIYDELMERRIWSGTRALAQQHLDAGQRVWLVTATPVELARIIAARLGLIPTTLAVGPSHAALAGLLPADWDAQAIYDHHQVMMRHGQHRCHFRAPDCAACEVLDLCPTGGGGSDTLISGGKPSPASPSGAVPTDQRAGRRPRA